MNQRLATRSNIFGSLLRKYPILVNYLLATVSLVATLIVAELVLRTVTPVDSRRPFEFRIPHPILGWVLQPNTTYLNETPEGKVSVTYNSQGWRDVEHAVKKPDGVFRILVVGDSFMEADSVELNDTFARRVEDIAHATGRHVEVINMGVAGYGTLQEYLVFRDIGRLYHPDLVLVAFFDGNDLANNSMELASILTEEGQVVNARPFLDPNDRKHWTITPVDFEAAQRSFANNKAALEAKRNEITNKLALLRLLTAGIAGIPVPGSLANQASPIEPVDKSRQELAMMGIDYCSEPPEYARAWGTTGRIFARFKGEVDASGGRLVVLDVPSLEEVSSEYMKAVTADVPNPDKLCLEGAPGEVRLRRMLTQLNIQQISLLPDFRRVTREDGKNLYQSDLHWNREGHSLAAQLVVSELIKRGLLPAPAELAWSTYR